MQIGYRIIYNKSNGQILYGVNYNCLGEFSDAVEGLRPTEIDFIDLPYGDKTLQDADKYHVDINTKQIVIDSIRQHQPAYEELQQQLLQAQGVI